MRSDFKVVLDACVLANFAVVDLLLRLAEKPRLFTPLWSKDIRVETSRTQIESLNWPPEISRSFKAKMQEAFPESMIEGHEYLIERCTNDVKDRHVLACAVHGKSELILTFNIKDFKEKDLSPWKVSAKHPQDYLLTLFDLEPLHVIQQLGAIAEKRKCALEDHLTELGRFLPKFSRRLLDELNP